MPGTGKYNQSEDLFNKMRQTISGRLSRTIDVQSETMENTHRPTLTYLLAGLLLLILIGTFILMLPISSQAGVATSFLTALYTSTSAVCVTGLVLVDTGTYWSGFGQFIIFILFQLGGLGFMTSATLILAVFLGKNLSLSERLRFRKAHFQGGLGSETVGRMGGNEARSLIINVVKLTFIIEIIGTIFFCLFKILDGSSLNLQTIWQGLFTCVSAFTNAGFDIEGNFSSFTNYGSQPLILLIMSVLILFGATGYSIWIDIFYKRSWKILTVDSKIVLSSSIILIIIPVIFLLAIEYKNVDIFADMSLMQSTFLSFINAIFVRTAGFSVIEYSQLPDQLLFLFSGLMFIGGASGSCAGGIKLTTFIILGYAIVATVRGQDNVNVHRTEIPWRYVYQALSVALLSVGLVFVTIFIISSNIETDFINVIFESISAFSTNGTSTGLSRELDELSQIVSIATMFIGRVGPLTIALILSERFERKQVLRYPEGEIAIG
ncbi:MAG: potassium transporter TrkG [Dehalococcoidia bacterium]|nr:potassium transporter TrkG [Dehalococcoidia bacterium]